MRRRRLVVLFASAGAVLTACNAITGASDLTADLCTDCGEDASIVPVADATTDHASPENDDAGVDSSGGGPTFCLGLVLYTTYDNDLASTVGSSVVSPTKAVIVEDGKFGKGLQAIGTTSTAYYPTDGADGGTLYPAKAGTIAFWFKTSLSVGLTTDRILVKPVIDEMASVNETGPQIRFDKDDAVLGITNQNPDAGYTTAGLKSTGPGGVPAGWNILEFNHIVGTWNRDSPLLQFFLNGGTTNDTFASSKAPWTPQVMGPTGFVRLSSSVSPSGGTFDDLAMWNRELAADEVQALYTSKVSLADACGL